MCPIARCWRLDSGFLPAHRAVFRPRRDWPSIHAHLLAFGKQEVRETFIVWVSISTSISSIMHADSVWYLEDSVASHAASRTLYARTSSIGSGRYHGNEKAPCRHAN